MTNFRWLRAGYEVIWHAYPAEQVGDAELTTLHAACRHAVARSDLLDEKPTVIWRVCLTDIERLDLFRRPLR